MADPKIVILHVREDDEEREIERRAFLRSSGLGEDRLVSVDALRVTPDAALLDGAAGLIIGGSGYSVFEEVPNLGPMRELVRMAHARAMPVLGVCFGAQLIADAFGGEVVRDKANEEVGTHVLRRTPDGAGDRLFAAAPDVFSAQCAHHDRVMRVPDGASVLAESDRCSVQAFRMGDGMTYAVQFHPERSVADFQRSISRRKLDHGGDPALLDEAYRALRETPEAEAVIRRFVDIAFGDLS